MSVPRALVLRSAGIDLYEANATFDKSSCHQALTCKWRTAFVVEAVQLLDVFWLGFYVECLRGCGLHSVGQLEAFDAGIKFCFGLKLTTMLGVRRAQGSRADFAAPHW